jgi:hypothetical protein
MSKEIQKKTVYRGDVSSGKELGYKKLGFISLTDNIDRRAENSPQLIGTLSLNGVGMFYVGLWKDEKIVVVKDAADRGGVERRSGV